MVHTRSAAGRSRRNYRAMDLGFVPPPVFYGVESNHPSVTPPPVFYGVESSNQYDNDFAFGRSAVPPPPCGFRGLYPCPPPSAKTSTKARRSGLWADFDDNEDEVLLVDAASQYDGQPTCMELLNTTLKIIASLCPGAPLLEAQPKQHVRQFLLEPLLVDPVCTPSSPLLDDAPIALKEVICTPPATLLVDAPSAIKEVS